MCAPVLIPKGGSCTHPVSIYMKEPREEKGDIYNAKSFSPFFRCLRPIVICPRKKYPFAMSECSPFISVCDKNHHKGPQGNSLPPSRRIELGKQKNTMRKWIFGHTCALKLFYASPSASSTLVNERTSSWHHFNAIAMAIEWCNRQCFHLTCSSLFSCRSWLWTKKLASEKLEQEFRSQQPGKHKETAIIPRNKNCVSAMASSCYRSDAKGLIFSSFWVSVNLNNTRKNPPKK